MQEDSYYREKFESLIKWLEECEETHYNLADRDFDNEDIHSAKENIASASMARRSRMWIRNRVKFERF